MYRDGFHWTVGPSHLLLPKACSKTNQWPFLRSSLRSTQGRPSGALLKQAFLTSVAVSLSSCLPFTSPWARVAFFPYERSLTRTLVSHLCRVCFCAFKIQLFFFLDFFFFLREFFFFFLQGPSLMQFPVILLALSLYLNWLRSQSLGRDPRS